MGLKPLELIFRKKKNLVVLGDLAVLVGLKHQRFSKADHDQYLEDLVDLAVLAVLADLVVLDGLAGLIS